MSKKTGTDPFKFPVKFGGASFGKSTASISVSVSHNAIGTLSQTLAFLTRSQLDIKIFEGDQTEKLNPKDGLVFISGIANTAKVSHDTDELGLKLSFDLDSVNHEHLIFFAYQDAMVEVVRRGEAGQEQHADDPDQMELEGVEDDEEYIDESDE